MEAPGNPIIPPDAPFSGPRFDAFRDMATASKQHGSLVLGQVSHPGRQTEIRLQANPVSASDVQLEGEVFGMRFAKPHAASKDEIAHIIQAFTHAAEFLHKAGYDGIELHGAHGYLLAQFLSQTTNKRTDEYGGSLPNRARLILEIARAIRAKLPPTTGFMVAIKINSVEFQKDGFTTAEAKQLVHLLEEAEFDFVELSGGTYEKLLFEHQRDSTRTREAFFLEFADSIAAGLTRTRTFVTGGFKTAAGMAAALKTVDGVGLGRPVCQEFALARDILDGTVAGALDAKLDQQDFGLTNLAAGTQIKQVGRDQRPIDLSVQENVDAFFKDVGTWMGLMKEDAQTMKRQGYVDLESVKSAPYGDGVVA